MKRVIIIIVALLTVSKVYSQNVSEFDDSRKEKVKCYLEEFYKYAGGENTYKRISEKDLEYVAANIILESAESRIESLESDLEELNKKLSNSYIASDTEAKNKIRKEIGDKKIKIYETVERHIEALKTVNMYDETWRKKYEKYGF